MYHTQLTISCLIYCVVKFISSEFTHYDAADYELKLLRLTTTDIWYSQRNHIFEIDLRNRSKARLILKWPSGEAARCSGIFSNCIGYIIYAVELKSGVFEICGILQKIATCSIYKYVGNYLKAISEERLANELINSDQDSTLFYHTNDSLMLLKQELDELPLILVRKLNSAAFSRSDAYHKMDAFWWRKQLLSRLPSVSGSLPMSIHALFHHKQHGYILYGEVKQNAHEADIFTRALNAAENMATYIARFCINDEGLQMPEDGRFILTALFRLTLHCSRKVKSHRENLDTFHNFRKNSVKTFDEEINVVENMYSGNEIILPINAS
nr:unnamed protein product [Spirometra erinaceieuropaei]